MPEVEILGAVGQVDDADRLLAAVKRVGEVLILDADAVCGPEHLRTAVEHAQRAFQRGTNAASSLPMETLLYASGERQISSALKKMGVRKGNQRLALVIFDGSIEETLAALGVVREDGVLSTSREKLIRMGVSEEELAALPPGLESDLVFERVAFVEMLKR
jgi:KEOPS complex subunit Cgi121